MEPCRGRAGNRRYSARLRVYVSTWGWAYVGIVEHCRRQAEEQGGRGSQQAQQQLGAAPEASVGDLPEGKLAQDASHQLDRAAEPRCRRTPPPPWLAEPASDPSISASWAAYSECQ
jgi:hypothetical protein